MPSADVGKKVLRLVFEKYEQISIDGYEERLMLSLDISPELECQLEDLLHKGWRLAGLARQYVPAAGARP